MPYIAIKSFPKDEETKRKAAEKVCAAITEAFNCPAEWVTVSFEDIAPEVWEEQIEANEIEPHMDRVYIRCGKKIRR